MNNWNGRDLNLELKVRLQALGLESTLECWIAITLSQRTNFRLFPTEFDERKFFKWVENTVGKGGSTCYDQFLLFPQCFQKACTAET